MPVAQKGLSESYFRSRKSMLVQKIVPLVLKKGFFYCRDAAADPKLAYPDVAEPSLRTYGPATRRDFINVLKAELPAALAHLQRGNIAPVDLAQAAIGLPDVTFRQTTFSIFGKYALDKSTAVRVTLGYQDSKLDEWSWSNNGVPFTYADNTTVKLKDNQSVTWIGASYIYKFQ
jgi:hypothetical protein